MTNRCAWAEAGPLMTLYHDTEWGVAVHDERTLFEFLTLEGAQAGLSWRTILNKRANYRAAFANFDPHKVARFNARHVTALMGNPGIVRNRLKIESTLSNARAFIATQQEFGSFDKFIWQFVDYKPQINRWYAMREVPVSTNLSDEISKELKKKGFRFVGTTICYAFMQAIGMVNDHLTTCFCHKPAVRRRPPRVENIIESG